MTLEELEKKRLEKYQEIDEIDEQICNLKLNNVKERFKGKYLRIRCTNKKFDDSTYMYCYNAVRRENVYCLRGISFTADDYSLNGYATIRWSGRTDIGFYDEKDIEKNVKIISKEEFDKKILSTTNELKENIERLIDNYKIDKK